jgi:hypothetical protein
VIVDAEEVADAAGGDGDSAAGDGAVDRRLSASCGLGGLELLSASAWACWRSAFMSKPPLEERLEGVLGHRVLHPGGAWGVQCCGLGVPNREVAGTSRHW